VAQIFISDLDGTLIPDPGGKNQALALEEIRKRKNHNPECMLVFASGRNIDLISKAIDEYRLPIPDICIADVGTRIYTRTQGRFTLLNKYGETLKSIIGSTGYDEVTRAVDSLPLRLQGEENQSTFKISYTVSLKNLEDTEKALDTLLKPLPWVHISSLDHSRKFGLIDIIPAGVSKSFAIEWLRTYLHKSSSDILYAGDSGNDLAVFLSDIPCIIVGNTPDGLKTEARQSKNNYIAEKKATEGVLEGLDHFQWK
jgi:HAD superfamily hydrolase (TIGR01484 family)